MVLGILEIVNVITVAVGAALIVAMYLRKQKDDGPVWICLTALYALLIGFLAFTALPENELTGRALAAICAIPALVSLLACFLMKQRTAARICAAVSTCCELLFLLVGLV